MKIGDPLDRSTDHGPQNHKAHLDKLLEYCDIGVKEGATLVYGGKQVDRPGKPSHDQESVHSMLLLLNLNPVVFSAWCGSLVGSKHSSTIIKV